MPTILAVWVPLNPASVTAQHLFRTCAHQPTTIDDIETATGDTGVVTTV